MKIDFLSMIPSILSITISLLPILLVIGLVFLVIYCWKNKVHIKWKTFKNKGFRPKRGDFGLYVYCGAQGSEKGKHLV